MVAHFATSTTIYICVHLAFGQKCQDDVEETHRYTSFTTGKTLEHVSDKMSKGICLQFCLDNINCVAAVEDTQARSCKYSETPTVRGVLPTNIYRHITFYRIYYRCPIHYSCDELPCQNGSTCEVVANDGMFGSTKSGSKCHCADGYTGWFCKEMYTCSDNVCQNQANCSMPNGTNGVVQCQCSTEYKGFYCDEKVMNEIGGYTKTTKTVIAIVATSVVALAGMATVAMALAGVGFAGAAAASGTAG